jgi:hypothetical protein
MPKHDCLDFVCSADEAAAILDVTPERVMVFCRQGRLKARKVGRDWIISTASLKEFSKTKRKPGRPKE